MADSVMPTHSATLTVPSDVQMLNVIRKTTAAVCEMARLNEDAIQNVVLSVHEAASNVIIHAHAERPEASISISYVVGSDFVEIRITDQGSAFDIEAVPQLDPGLPRPGGRGVFLMRQLMDEVSSLPLPGGGNQLRMVKHRT